MYYKRQISEKLVRLAEQFPCLVVTGGRQVGKSTLLKKLFPSHKVVTLDLPSLAEQAEKSPALFLRQNPPPLLIDEVQYAPGLFRHLKILIDGDRHKMGQFILTGSQKFILMKELSESLAGRAAIVSLENLSLLEVLDSPPNEWSALISRGFFPELWRQQEMDAQDFYSSYLATYIERDLRQVLNVQSLRDFERFIRACAARSGGLLNLSDLARDVGIKSQTARDWLSALEASNQICLLEPYFENVGKRIVKSPKLYLNDSGFLCYLLGLDKNTVSNSPLIGSIWETFIFGEFRKSLKWSPQGSLWFYRDGQGREIDFVFSGQGSLDLFEVKWTESHDVRWIDRLEEVGSILERSRSNKVRSLSLICRVPHEHKVANVRVLNPYFMHT